MGARQIRMTHQIHSILNNMAEEIDAWGTINFPIKIPKMGILEELGEMAHCPLKRVQKIRKMDQDDVFYPKFMDCCADLTVYMLHDMFMQGLKFMDTDFEGPDEPIEIDLLEKDDMEEFFGNFAEIVAWLLGGQAYSPGSVQIHLAIYRFTDYAARWANFDLLAATQETWKVVQLRKWLKNPENAHEQTDVPTELEIYNRCRFTR